MIHSFYSFVSFNISSAEQCVSQLLGLQRWIEGLLSCGGKFPPKLNVSFLQRIHHVSDKMNSLKTEDEKFLLCVLQAFLKIQIFSSSVMWWKWKTDRETCADSVSHLAKWACAGSLWKQTWVLHCWVRVKYKEAINTLQAPWAEHIQHPSGTERLDPETRPQLSWLTWNQIGPTTKEKVEKDAWVFLKTSLSYKFPSWESLLAALVPLSCSCRQAAMLLPPLVCHCPLFPSCSYVQTQNVVHIIIWKA